jgi:hypothetical protein
LRRETAARSRQGDRLSLRDCRHFLLRLPSFFDWKTSRSQQTQKTVLKRRIPHLTFTSKCLSPICAIVTAHIELTTIAQMADPNQSIDAANTYKRRCPFSPSGQKRAHSQPEHHRSASLRQMLFLLGPFWGWGRTDPIPRYGGWRGPVGSAS